MDLKTMTVEQLKAAAYDQISFLEQAQKNLKTINAEIEKRNKETKKEDKK